MTHHTKRHPTQLNHSAIFRHVAQNPGITAFGLARDLGLAYNNIQKTLAATDNQGFLLSEDEQGRLYAWEPPCSLGVGSWIPKARFIARHRMSA